jgi:hypothetical protein
MTGRFFPAEQIDWAADDLRESGLAAGINSRIMAVLYTVETCYGNLSPYNTKIYSAEAVTDLALLMRDRFAKFVGSEYTTDLAVAEALFQFPLRT